MEKEFNYLYKITNKINQKYYLGVHSTNNMDDGYMGSGKYIKRSIEKHGLENHVKEVLNYFEDRGELMEAEKRIVSIELIKSDTLCMNMKVGGEGGCMSGEDAPMFGKNHSKEVRRKMSESAKGRNHSIESRQKISESTKGKNNPMFGRTGEESPRFGKELSREHAQKLLNSNLGKPCSEEKKLKIGFANNGAKNGMFGRTGGAHPNFGKKSSEETKVKVGKASKENWKKILDSGKFKITFRGVEYRSVNECFKITGISKYMIKKEIKNKNNYV